MASVIIILAIIVIIAVILSFSLFFKIMSGKAHSHPDLNIDKSSYPASTVKSPDEIIVMTLNLAHGRKDGRSQIFQKTDDIKTNLEYAGKVINTHHADVVSLQEADAPSVWSGNFNHVEHLTKSAQYPFFIQGEHVKGMRLAYGTAIISKLFLGEPVSETFKIAAPLFTKGFVTATITMGEQNEPVEIVSLHLDFARKSVRKKQADRIIDRFKYRDNPLIVMGDFNSSMTTKRSVVKQLMEELDLKAYRPDDNSIFTFPFTKKRIDWILVSKRFEYIEHKVIPEIVSDHYSIISKIKLTPQ